MLLRFYRVTTSEMNCSAGMVYMYLFRAFLQLKETKFQLLVLFLMIFQLLAKLICSFFARAKLSTNQIKSLYKIQAVKSRTVLQHLLEQGKCITARRSRTTHLGDLGLHCAAVEEHCVWVQKI